MKPWDGDTFGGGMAYPGTVVLDRASGRWTGRGYPAGTPILVVFPENPTDEEVDDLNAFRAASTVIPFRGRSGWVLAHRLARRIAAEQSGTRRTGSSLLGFRYSPARRKVGPVTLGREVADCQWLADEIFGAPRPHTSGMSYFDTDAAQRHAATRRRWLRERHATAANRHRENLHRGAEMLREHFGGDWPRGGKALFAFLCENFHLPAWADVGVVALCELFRSDAGRKAPPASGLRIVGEAGPVLETAVTVHASAEDFIREARLSRQALSHLEASPLPDGRDPEFPAPAGHRHQV